MGTVGRPHGVKGELALAWHGDYIPAAGDVIFLGQQDTLHPWTVLRSRLGKRLILALAGVDNRTAAEALNGSQAWMARDSLPTPEEDACYLADLIGCAVRTQDGQLLGHLDHFEFPAGQPVWSIKDDKRREILFPAMPCFIVSLNPQAREAVIAPPPGLLEVYRA